MSKIIRRASFITAPNTHGGKEQTLSQMCHYIQNQHTPELTKQLHNTLWIIVIIALLLTIFLCADLQMCCI